MEKEERVPDLKARAYQLELYEHAKKQNSILLLGTGSGKTFISILLIKDFGDQIRRSLGKNRKWTVFIVNTVPLVYQQGKAIEQHTPYSVGVYESSKEVDYWTEEKWKEELRDHEVLVMVAQIFHDLIISSCLPLEKINLLIFDECHHATGNHPMREIMRRFSKLQRGANVPRILGLTACPINGKCKFEDVEKIIKDLETTLHSPLVTSVDLEAVKVHTTAPKEILVSYDATELSEYAETIKGQLTGVKFELDEMTHIDERYIKPLKKKLINITKVLCHLGDWFGAQAVKYEMENFEEAEDNEDIPVVRDLKKLLCERLEQIYQYCLRKEEQMLNPLDHITIKVKKLLDILRLCGDGKYGLIFVETRNTAKLLYDFLRKISLKNEELSFIVPAYVISANARNSFDIQLIKEELKKQRETLAAFARGEINFVVCTSILEEGVDVRKCNVVIRFDEPKTFRAYVQSRGRARALPSRYVLMVEESSRKDFLSDVALYRITEDALSKMCHNRQLPTDLEINSHFAEDEIVAPYEPYGPGGAVVTFNSAVPLINQYCGMLPQDRFADLTPSIEYEKEKDGGIQVRARIRLPINAPLKTIIQGDWMSNRVHAKKSAAMAMCKKLHEMNELNEYLRPERRTDDSILDDLVEIPPEVCNRDGMPEPGTKKRRQMYKREMCQGLSPMDDSFKLYSVNVQSNERLSNGIAISSEARGMSVGLLCKQALRSNPFSLYSSKWNEVVIRIQLIDEDLSLDSEVISDIKHFHKVVYENLLGISHSLFDYCPQQTSLFILPLRGNSIDTSLLRHIASLDSLRIHNERSLQDIFTFERSIFEDAVIYPLYKPLSEGMFYVTEIHDNMNPLDPFPESRKQFSSYEQYFLREYGEEITNRYQPLISAKHLPKDLNFLKKRNTEQASRKSRRDPPKYIPELCGVLPLKASLWWQIMLLPSVLHRLNSLLVAEKLRELIFPHSLVPDGNWENNIIDFDWPREVRTKLMEASKRSHNKIDGSNLSVILANSAAKPIHSFMILNAVTLLGANDNFDGERLEVLGDSFLKFVIAERLFLKFSDDHEGNLSERRSKLVCNRTLYSLGKAKHIPEKIQSFILNPAVNGIMPGFVLKAEVDKKLRKINAPHDLWARFGDTSEEEFNKEVRKMHEGDKAKASCYNPWTEHELGDKSVADSVEALIGVFLLVGGNEAAIAFLHNLGIGVCRGSSLLRMQLPVKSALLNDGQEAVEEVERYYKKNCLDDLEKKINYKFRDKSYLVQAVTHSSYSQNRITDCYQRLEFLGDAVLDYLVTGLIFSSNNNYTPGELSDLRSYYVKNETLAKVSVKYNLQRHLLYLAPKLQASIGRYLNLLEDGMKNEEELLTEDDEVILTEVDVPKALGDLVEAIVGAVYLDSGRSLQKAWDVVRRLMGDIIDQTLTDIPINCIRKLYEKVPSRVKFIKKPMQEDDTMAEYEVIIDGFPPVIGRGKNYKVAKIAAAKRGLRMLKKKEREAAHHQSFEGS